MVRGQNNIDREVVELSATVAVWAAVVSAAGGRGDVTLFTHVEEVQRNVDEAVPIAQL